MLTELIAMIVRTHPRLVRLVNEVARRNSPDTVLVLDYPVRPRQRWGPTNPHPELLNILEQYRESYRSRLTEFLKLADCLVKIPAQRLSSTPAIEPCWINGWMPALDGIALYGFLVEGNPALYVEIGSGNSTKFARRAITDHKLRTRIISIDPHPRAEIDDICDEVIRSQVEEVDLSVFDRLQPGDILYVDNSHRVFTNSDATVVFLEIIPRLNLGVRVEIHDVTLPYDYLPEWSHSHYSEQYLLAAYLLSGGNRLMPVLPGFFVSCDAQLKNVLASLWEKPGMLNVERHGVSFWAEIT